ncbi:MAG: MBL fold metallo-hydrolase [Actinomycetia bacterium]|nr:MBL fold metallo-hydrolase [Actinomycetes bacterium]
MTTDVVITGTGCPIPTPGRAGPGVLVKYGDLHLQFDAGRSTVLRLTEAGSGPGKLSAVFLTHHHSDHVTGLADLVLTRWVMDRTDNTANLPIVSPEGPSSHFVERLLDIWDDDLAVRREHTGRTSLPGYDSISFPVPDHPAEVWRSGDVVVRAGQVRHEPVPRAVGYRIETPDGVVVISGDTLVCDEMAELSQGADVLVYEAMRFSSFDGLPSGRTFVLDYHADTAAIGPQALALDVPTLVLTHLIPPPVSDEAKQAFADDVRAGGFAGELIVADDLTTVSLRA